MNTASIISLCISAVMMLIGISTYFRNKNKDDRDNDNGIKEGLLKANMKLDQVCNTTNETRTDIKAMDRTIIALDKRLTIVENEVEEIKKGI